MKQINTDQMTITDIKHMPIIKHFARQIGLVETIDQLVDTQMALSPGMAVLAMVLDTLSGRTPLYRLPEFFCRKGYRIIVGCSHCIRSVLRH